jgi:hypothetical protein
LNAYINVVKRVFIVLIASAGTNEMCHCEFNKSWFDPPWVITEKHPGSSPFACEDGRDKTDVGKVKVYNIK